MRRLPTLKKGKGIYSVKDGLIKIQKDKKRKATVRLLPFFKKMK